MRLTTARSKRRKSISRADARERESREERAAQERAAQERAAQESAAREVQEKKGTVRRRVITVVVSAAVIGLVAAGLIYLQDLNVKRDAQARAEMANTKIVLEQDSDQDMLRRVDGSYYSVSVDEAGATSYGYTSLDEDGVVVEKTVADYVVAGRVLWTTRWDEVDVTVRVIGTDDVDAEPRVETQRCTVQPIDATKPSFTGDPHSSSHYEPGTGEKLPDDSFWGDAPKQICEDRIILWVPDGAVQP